MRKSAKASSSPSLRSAKLAEAMADLRCARPRSAGMTSSTEPREWASMRAAAALLPPMKAWQSDACRLLSSPRTYGDDNGVTSEGTVRTGLHFNKRTGLYENGNHFGGDDPATARQAASILRRFTWEDWGLDPEAPRLTINGPRLEALNEPRHTYRCRRQLHCDALGLPVATRTVHRPAKGYIYRPLRHADGASPHEYFALAIEKSGLSTLEDFFVNRAHSRGSGDKALSWGSVRTLPRCKNTTNMRLIEDVAALVNARSGTGAARPRGSPMDSAAAALRGTSRLATFANRSACGFAATFDLHPEATPTFNFAVVRDPLQRFISGFNDHGVHGGLSRCPPWQPGGCPTVLEQLQKHATELQSGKFVAKLVPKYAGVHYLTQTYFLSSTDLRGCMISWDAIGRLEHVERDLGSIGRLVMSTSNDPSSSKGSRGSFAPRAVFAARNKKTCHGCIGNSTLEDTSSARRRGLTEQLLNDSKTMCTLCRLYGQDYVCLGYAFPLACLQPACLETMPQRLQDAIALAQQRYDK